jgi:hypothetical protein
MQQERRAKSRCRGASVFVPMSILMIVVAVAVRLQQLPTPQLVLVTAFQTRSIIALPRRSTISIATSPIAASISPRGMQTTIIPSESASIFSLALHSHRPSPEDTTSTVPDPSRISRTRLIKDRLTSKLSHVRSCLHSGPDGRNRRSTLVQQARNLLPSQRKRGQYQSVGRTRQRVGVGGQVQTTTPTSQRLLKLKPNRNLKVFLPTLVVSFLTMLKLSSKKAWAMSMSTSSAPTQPLSR